MAITIYTEDEIRDALLGYFRIQFPTQDLSDTGFLGDTARAVAQSLLLIQADIQRADDDAIPAYQLDSDGTIRTRASSEALDAWAFVFGLPSDTAGIYGRKGPVPSTGGVGDPTGVTGTIFPAGSLLLDSTGQVQVKLNAAFQVGVSPTGSSSYTAVTKGSSSNLPAGSILTFVSPPTNGNPTVTLTVGLSKGSDREEDSALLERILFRLQNPPKGGVAADYRFWAENSFDSTGASLNIGRAYVFPLRGGLGTVDVMPLLSSSGIGRSAGDPAMSGTIANQVQTYLNMVRPVTATVRVIQPNMPPEKALLVRAYVIPNGSKYEYDWVGSSAGYPIIGATTNTITVGGTIPNLDKAVDLSLKPRIQIINSSMGASPLPYQRRVISRAGATTYTLDAPISPLPRVIAYNDLLFAGGPIVDPVSQTILAYFDSLGPSRQSKYADIFDSWEDQITLARLADIILEVKDTDGTRMLTTIPKIGTTPFNLNIAVNSALITSPPDWKSDDYQPQDLAGVCDLPYLRAGGILIVRAP